MTDLDSTDALRLNVLLAQPLLALKIEESRMRVVALTDRGEAIIDLNPVDRADRYLKLVQQTISGHVLGSPGGYPVFLKRWTRMGQTRAENLDKLLLLGEPEAVTAVVYAPELTGELARRAWWASPSAEHAREMLKRESVRESGIAAELVAFLMEFLPFEEEPADRVHSVAQVLQSGQLRASEIEALWKNSKRKSGYLTGFLLAGTEHIPQPDSLAPADEPQTQVFAKLPPILRQLLASWCSKSGRLFLQCFDQALKKAGSQVEVGILFYLLGERGQAWLVDVPPFSEIDHLRNQIDNYVCGEPPTDLPESFVPIEKLPPSEARILAAALLLGLANERLLSSVFSRTDAQGSVMRKRLGHITLALSDAIEILGAADSEIGVHSRA